MAASQPFLSLAQKNLSRINEMKQYLHIEGGQRRVLELYRKLKLPKHGFLLRPPKSAML